ncbi:hypothetical protein [Thermoleophilum album]|uniref:Uncharacterized protein n=1 Tax=Thermoleophilum album TaxID=29539 RepID=A0A1H6G234_THEAL|nr:hypothetical protein [Thermoleophilum album]SEH16343.1 hypothetical protein SAMN02745716_2148 [Thermoleophilum album]
MIHLVTTADTEILACARAVERLRGAEPDFPAVRCFNPGPTGQGETASAEELVAEIARRALPKPPVVQAQRLARCS